ncbi:MAG: M36 family metallopeptidase, partial [Magnetococcales bacterium]|nr:M36 family metallopeptidase [Magnetococcales bacterium]
MNRSLLLFALIITLLGGMRWFSPNESPLATRQTTQPPVNQTTLPPTQPSNPTTPPTSPPSNLRTVAERQLRQMHVFPPDGAARPVIQHIHDTGSGPIVVKARAKVDELEVFGHETNLLFDRDLNQVANSGDQSIPPLPSDRSFHLGANKALDTAFKNLGGTEPREGWHQVDERDGYQYFSADFSKAEYRLRKPARVKAVLYPGETELIPAYAIELRAGDFDRDNLDAHLYVISARDGTVLFDKNQRHNSAYGYRVFALPDGEHTPMNDPNGTQGIPNPTGTPVTPPYLPEAVAQNLITQQNGPISTADPWLPDNATTTSGNNVDVQASVSSTALNSSLVNKRAPITSPGLFDHRFNASQTPLANPSQLNASLVQLFFTINFLHDLFYDQGFNESAGNGQANNYGRGGLGSDPILVTLSDATTDRDNASMATDADGASPTLVVGIWGGSQSIQLHMTQPESKRIVNVERAKFGPETYSVSGDLVRMEDGVDPIHDGCQTPTNASALRGRIVVIDRGLCLFTEKVRIAQSAGAVGVLIVDQSGITELFPMTGTDSSITIPSVLLFKADGDALNALLNSGKNVTMTLSCSQNSDINGALDNLVVAHEWGHYLTERLIGNGAGLNNNQGESLGEGWSDFVAMLLAVRPETGDNAYRGTYAVAAYSYSNQPEQQPYYYGLRRVPYSIDFSKNALTFKHIENRI